MIYYKYIFTFIFIYRNSDAVVRLVTLQILHSLLLQRNPLIIEEMNKYNTSSHLKKVKENSDNHSVTELCNVVISVLESSEEEDDLFAPEK